MEWMDSIASMDCVNRNSISAVGAEKVSTCAVGASILNLYLTDFIIIDHFRYCFIQKSMHILNKYTIYKRLCYNRTGGKV